MVLELERPVVQSTAAFFDDARGADIEGPDAERGVHDLPPDAFVVEVFDSRHRIVAADDAVDEVLLLGVGRAGVYAKALLRLVPLRELAPELLAVDVDRLEVATRVLDATRQAVLDVVGQRREQVR